MSDEQQKIGTGQVIELNGKYWGRTTDKLFGWVSWVDLMNATIFNNQLRITTDVVMDNDDEYENLAKAKIIPIKEITIRQVGEF